MARVGITRASKELPFPDPGSTARHYVENHLDIVERLKDPVRIQDSEGNHRWLRLVRPERPAEAIIADLTKLLAAAIAQADTDDLEIWVSTPDPFAVPITEGIDELERRWRERPTKRRANVPAPLPSLLKFPADRVHKGAVEAFSITDQWKPRDGFFRGYEVSGKKDDFAMLCGFPVDPGEEVWKILLARGETAIKAHYALWARLYEQTGGRPGQYAIININQFCADLGFKRHHKGGFRREQKQDAVKLLEAMTTVEVAVRFLVGGKNGRIREISGQLWQRGLLARERDQYGDLFGQAREGDADLWDPAGFSFGPGPWFADPEWRRQNEYLGLIGAGLMKLEADSDQTAIRIGGYLGTLARFSQYRVRPIRVATLLQRIGMENRYLRNPERLQEKIEEALNKLIDVGILARWGDTNADPIEPDMDDPEQIAALADQPLTDWRRKTIEIEWPAEMETACKRLEAAQRKAIAALAKKDQKAN